MNTNTQMQYHPDRKYGRRINANRERVRGYFRDDMYCVLRSEGFSYREAHAHLRTIQKAAEASIATPDLSAQNAETATDVKETSNSTSK